MAYLGGDTLSITIQNPKLGSVVFEAKAAEDTNYDLGGTRVLDEESSVTGSGTNIAAMTRKRWKVPVVIAADMITDLDIEKANKIAADTSENTITISNLNGSVYRGKGRIVGDIVLNTAKATCPITLSGGGKLEKIA